MGRGLCRFITISLLLSLNLGYALKQKTSESALDKKRSYYLDLMFNAWAVNKNAINAKGYLKSADSLSKEEYEALKVYFKPIATDPARDLKTVQSIAQDNANVNGLFRKLEAKTPLTAQDVLRWKDGLDKLHKRLLAAIEQRVGGDTQYSEFLRDEKQRTLGNYQAAYVARTSLAKQVTRLEEKNEMSQEELWTKTLRDPHTEMLIRIRQGVEILYATFLDFEQQRFQRPEGRIGIKTPVVDTSVDIRSHIRTDVQSFEDGPNPLLPPLRNGD